MTKQEALDWAGGTVALADRLDITPGAVSQWEKEIPQLQQYKLWQLSAGKLQVDKKYAIKTEGSR